MEDAILITNAYKRGTVVILDVKDYIEECERQINNTENYNRLQNGTTGANNELVHSVIKRFKTQKLSCKSIAEGLKINSPRNPRLYAQHKIYKKENPGIPVRCFHNLSYIQNFRICLLSSSSKQIETH